MLVARAKRIFFYFSLFLQRFTQILKKRATLQPYAHSFCFSFLFGIKFDQNTFKAKFRKFIVDFWIMAKNEKMENVVFTMWFPNRNAYGTRVVRYRWKNKIKNVVFTTFAPNRNAYGTRVVQHRWKKTSLLSCHMRSKCIWNVSGAISLTAKRI